MDDHNPPSTNSTSESTTEPIDARSEKGLAILQYAFTEGGKVLEFDRDNDELIVTDITDHHNELQRLVDEQALTVD